MYMHSLYVQCEVLHVWYVFVCVGAWPGCLLVLCMLGVCMGGCSGNRQSDREFLWMINGLWKEAPCPSDTLAGSELGLLPTFWWDQPR